jgi:hypothetical protein
MVVTAPQRQMTAPQRQIRAVHTAGTITVYQAYSPETYPLPAEIGRVIAHTP